MTQIYADVSIRSACIRALRVCVPFPVKRGRAQIVGVNVQTVDLYLTTQAQRHHFFVSLLWLLDVDAGRDVARDVSHIG
jgi:hypothetical protein